MIDPNDDHKLTLIAELMDRGFDNDEDLNGLLHEAYDAGAADQTAKIAELKAEVERLKIEIHNVISLSHNIKAGSLVFTVDDIERVAKKALKPVQSKSDKQGENR